MAWCYPRSDIMSSSSGIVGCAGAVSERD